MFSWSFEATVFPSVCQKHLFFHCFCFQSSFANSWFQCHIYVLNTVCSVLVISTVICWLHEALTWALLSFYRLVLSISSWSYAWFLQTYFILVVNYAEVGCMGHKIRATYVWPLEGRRGRWSRAARLEQEDRTGRKGAVKPKLRAKGG